MARRLESHASTHSGHDRFGTRKQSGIGYRSKNDVTIAEATSCVLDKLRRMGFDDVGISTDLQLLPRWPYLRAASVTC